MSEGEPTKASKAREDLMSRQVSPEDMARRHPKIAELRLREDAPSIEFGRVTPEIIEHAQGEGISAITLKERGQEPTVVVLSIDRYLELVGKELASSYTEKVGRLDGHIVPVESALTDSHVETVDPNETWTHDGEHQALM